MMIKGAQLATRALLCIQPVTSYAWLLELVPAWRAHCEVGTSLCFLHWLGRPITLPATTTAVVATTTGTPLLATPNSMPLRTSIPLLSLPM